MLRANKERNDSVLIVIKRKRIEKEQNCNKRLDLDENETNQGDWAEKYYIVPATRVLMCVFVSS